MPYVSNNYASNPLAPWGYWVGSQGEYGGVADHKDDRYYGECVSYVKAVTPGLPKTDLWRPGDQVRGNTSIKPGTVIATFNSRGQYEGHSAIYESQTKDGINAVDQWIRSVRFPPRPIHRHLLGFRGDADNNGNKFFVVERRDTHRRRTGARD